MFIKKWWLNIPYHDDKIGNVVITGWINTLHDCKDKNLVPNKIAGTLSLKHDEEGNKSFAFIDQNIIEMDEWELSIPKGDSFGETLSRKYFILANVKYKITPDEGNLTNPDRISKILDNNVLKCFEIQGLRIEDFLVEDLTYIDQY